MSAMNCGTLSSEYPSAPDKERKDGQFRNFKPAKWLPGAFPADTIK
jgi:hypothetical protein